MELKFSSLIEGADPTTISLCDNDQGGCDDSGCDTCQSGCETDCDGT